MIEKLTPEQEVALIKWREEWLRIGLNTSPVDRPQIEKAVKQIYGLNDLSEPQIIWADGPASGAQKLMELKKETNTLSSQLNQFRFWGQHEAYWVSFYRFCEEIVGVKFSDEQSKLLALWESLCYTGWWATWDKYVIMCERPEVQLLNDQGRLHCEDGPAVKTRDGWQLFCLNGVRVPEMVVMDPKSLTIKQIKNESNAEVRRVMREQYGEGAYLTETGSTLIDADHEIARKGAEPRCLLEDDEGRRFLVGTDGSTGRTYYMEVDPEIEKCNEAHNSLCGFDESRILNKS